MAFLERYQRQVALLLRVLPIIADEPDFALKGGTAINLFVRDMPRLSVDIDLTYLPVADRATSLAAIDRGMANIAQRIGRALPTAQIEPVILQQENITTKLIIRLDNAQIKIEVTPVLRGTVFEPIVMSVTAAVEEAFGFAQMPVVSLPDLYAGKIVAALTRQHPRDLFDVRDLLANEGISDELRAAFIVYAISGDRSIGDTLAPNRKSIEQPFASELQGMTANDVTLDDLLEAREAIIATMVADMPEAHHQFLIGFKRGEPDWSLLDVAGADKLPAVQWKLLNLAKLPDGKRAAMADRLAAIPYPAG
jgi:predicted nucleotidyltransferase component of viral defense system